MEGGGITLKGGIFMIEEILDKVKEGIVGKITEHVQEANEKKILEQQIIKFFECNPKGIS